MNDIYEVCWDWGGDGNAAHVAEHGVAPEEVEQVLGDRIHDRVPDKNVPQRWVVWGFTSNGRYLKVVFELQWVEEWSVWAVYPITAFDD